MNLYFLQSLSVVVTSSGSKPKCSLYPKSTPPVSHDHHTHPDLPLLMSVSAQSCSFTALFPLTLKTVPWYTTDTWVLFSVYCLWKLYLLTRYSHKVFQGHQVCKPPHGNTFLPTFSLIYKCNYLLPSVLHHKDLVISEFCIFLNHTHFRYSTVTTLVYNVLPLISKFKTNSPSLHFSLFLCCCVPLQLMKPKYSEVSQVTLDPFKWIINSNHHILLWFENGFSHLKLILVLNLYWEIREGDVTWLQYW